MTEWFKERYIPRDEHERIVDYYRNLVAQLHVKVREARIRVDADVLDAAVEHSRRLADRSAPQAQAPGGVNVIRVDFGRRRGSKGLGLLP